MSCSTSPLFLSALAAAPLALFAAAPAPAVACSGSTIWHIFEEDDEEAEVVYSLPIATVGLWRTGSGAVPDPDLELGIFGLASRVNQPADGRSIEDFEIYSRDGELRFALVYSAAEAAEELATDLSAGEFTDLFDAGQEPAPFRGRHLADFETYFAGGQRRYAALFVDGSQEQILDLSLSGNQIKTRIEGSLLVKKRRLVDFEVLSPGSPVSSPTFAAFFDDEAGSQRFFAQVGAAEFHQLVHLQSDDGYRLEDVETWRDAEGDTFFAALFEAATSDDHLYILQCGPGPCQNPGSVDLAVDHVAAAVDDVAQGNSSLNLVDFELPLGAVLGNDFLPRPGGLGGVRQRSRPPADSGLGGVIIGGPPTCQHGGVLHDGGTNGPSTWP